MEDELNCVPDKVSLHLAEFFSAGLKKKLKNAINDLRETKGKLEIRSKAKSVNYMEKLLVIFEELVYDKMVLFLVGGFFSVDQNG